MFTRTPCDCSTPVHAVRDSCQPIEGYHCNVFVMGIELRLNSSVFWPIRTRKPDEPVSAAAVARLRRRAKRRGRPVQRRRQRAALSLEKPGGEEAEGSLGNTSRESPKRAISALSFLIQRAQNRAPISCGAPTSISRASRSLEALELMHRGRYCPEFPGLSSCLDFDDRSSVDLERLPRSCCLISEPSILPLNETPNGRSTDCSPVATIPLMEVCKGEVSRGSAG